MSYHYRSRSLVRLFADGLVLGRLQNSMSLKLYGIRNQRPVHRAPAAEADVGYCRHLGGVNSGRLTARPISSLTYELLKTYANQLDTTADPNCEKALYTVKRLLWPCPNAGNPPQRPYGLSQRPYTLKLSARPGQAGPNGR